MHCTVTLLLMCNVRNIVYCRYKNKIRGVSSHDHLVVVLSALMRDMNVFIAGNMDNL